MTLEECKKIMEENDGDLILRGENITSLPDGLKVVRDLDLRGMAITSLPEDITVFCCVFHNRFIKQRIIQEETVYVPGKYLYCDGILTHVRDEKKVGNYIYYKGKIPGKNVVYDGQYYAHCKTFSEGVEDISYKKAEERGADQYKSLKTDSIVSKEEAISMYRVITGACSAGTHHFISGLDDSLIKDSYSVQEIIDLTKGQYGSSQFKAFFER